MDQPSTVYYSFGGLTFEWHSLKAEMNVRKHGVMFEQAAQVFIDEFALTLDDPEHSEDEPRVLLFAVTTDDRLLAVSHVER